VLALFLVRKLNFVLLSFSLGAYLFLTSNNQGDVEHLKKNGHKLNMEQELLLKPHIEYIWKETGTEEEAET